MYTKYKRSVNKKPARMKAFFCAAEECHRVRSEAIPLPGYRFGDYLRVTVRGFISRGAAREPPNTGRFTNAETWILRHFSLSFHCSQRQAGPVGFPLIAQWRRVRNASFSGALS